MENYSEEEDSASLGREDTDSSACEMMKPKYVSLSHEDIRERQDNAIAIVSSFCSFSRPESIILLHHFSWSLSGAVEGWFADEQKLSTDLGLLHRSPILESSSEALLYCGICMEFCLAKEMRAVGCGHYFCCECWRHYIHNSLNHDGLDSLCLRCPFPECGAAVGEDMVLSVSCPEDRSKYEQYLYKSYVEHNGNLQWCPAPGCEYAVELVTGIECSDVRCRCSHRFCWDCLEEVHRPVDCETVRKWNLMNEDGGDTETKKWLDVYTKRCPKCQRCIEKISGCICMTCLPPCRHQFCWMCLGDWNIHHGSHSSVCNAFEKERKRKNHRASEVERDRVEKSLQKYQHDYERWAANEMSKVKALKDLQRIEDEVFEKLKEFHGDCGNGLRIVRAAWLQIVECRRVLKWTYAYDFYLPEEDAGKQFFEFLQASAQSDVERLHDFAENGLDAYAKGRKFENLSFEEFCNKLENLTMDTQAFSKNMVEICDNEMSLSL